MKYFKQWNREYKYLVLVHFLLIPLLGLSQDIFSPDPIIVTASRIRSVLTAGLREIIVIEKNEIDALPVGTVADLLSFVGGVDIQRRGGGAIQADFSLRGCAFEQVLILVDGVRINDPQTGHHNSDIPLTLSDIKRIEILPGHGSSLYGSNGYGGVIHIISNQADKNQLQFELTGGSYRTYSGTISQSIVNGNYKGRFSFERKASDGYRWDSDYNCSTFSHRSSIRNKIMAIDWSIGYTSKDFGANGFYADFPSRENTKTLSSIVNLIYGASTLFTVESKIFGRKHNDLFVLDFQRPEWYTNDNETYTYGGDAVFNLRFTENKEIALGVETVHEDLSSTNLGIHKRIRSAIYGEAVFSIAQQCVLDGSIRIDYEKLWGGQINPALNFRYDINSSLRFRGSAGKSFRTPNFTELFYDSPANKGNVNLKPESAWSWEFGMVFGRKYEKVEVSLFLRNETDRIEWITKETGTPWLATNIGRSHVSGVSINAQTEILRNCSLRIHYNYLNRVDENDRDYRVKYGFNIPKHHILLSAFLKLSSSIDQSIIINGKDRNKTPFYFLLDSKTSFHLHHTTLFINFLNILRTVYEEIPGVPMPGKTIQIGSLFRL
jgi:vitamin B12 transporter